jgi:4-amino-4-deoxy-L-arabinose transferase-like glycosyltransferase
VVSTRSWQTGIILLCALLASTYVFFFLNLGSYSLKEPDEGRYAEIPREMVEQGNYIVPHLNYVRYFEKPPLFYWMTAASYRLLGVNEWSARLPNALMALCCVLMMYAFGSRWFGRRMALISAFVLSSSFGFFAMARIVTIDMLFTFTLFASLLCFCQFYREKKRLFLYLFYAALALAVLAKGPVAIILLPVTIFIFLFFEKRLSFLKEMALPGGLLLFAMVALPWFVVMCIKEKEFFQFFFVDQHVLRFLTSKHSRSGPVYYFIPVLFGGLFPWSVFIPRAAVRLWRVRELRLFFIWSFVVFLFFSASGSKLPTYILPIYPALALILGYLFEGGWRQRIERNRELVVYVGFFICVALGCLAYGSGILGRYLTLLPDVVALSESIRGLSLGFGLLSLAMIIFLSFRKGHTYCGAFFILGTFSLCVIVGLMTHVHVIDRINTTKGLAREISARRGADAVVVNYGSFDETLPFYLARRTYIAEFTGELEMGAKYPDAAAFFIRQDGVAQLVRSEKPVFVVMKTRKVSALGLLGLDERGIVGRENQRVLVANRSALPQ